MKLVFATHNHNKLKEVRALLSKDIELLSLTDIGCFEDIPETAPTIEGNALLKAQHVKENYGYNCFADDTGLEVAALDGAPGVYSARYAGPENNAQANIQKLLKNLENKEDRSAQFKTVIALLLDTDQKLFTGVCTGVIIQEQKGDKGFGYDPIFKPTGYSQTFAEMDQNEKGRISHRGKAISQLIEFLKNC